MWRKGRRYDEVYLPLEDFPRHLNPKFKCKFEYRKYKFHLRTFYVDTFPPHVTGGFTSTSRTKIWGCFDEGNCDFISTLGLINDIWYVRDCLPTDITFYRSKVCQLSHQTDDAKINENECSRTVNKKAKLEKAVQSNRQKRSRFPVPWGMKSFGLTCPDFYFNR